MGGAAGLGVSGGEEGRQTRLDVCPNEVLGANCA